MTSLRRFSTILAAVLSACGSEPLTLEIPAALLGKEGEAITVTVAAKDPAGGAITLSAAPLPSGAVFDAKTGTLTWTPPFDAGRAEAYVVTVTANAGERSIKGRVAVVVQDVNRKPTLTVPGPQSVDEASPLSFPVTATDPDPEDTVTISAHGLPADATFQNGTFSWTPGYGQAGNYTVTFLATDDHRLSAAESSGEQTVAITVAEHDTAPTLAAITNSLTLGVAEDELLEIVVHAEDPDGDQVQVQVRWRRSACDVNGTDTPGVDGLPGEAAFIASMLTFTPDFTAAGSYCFTFVAHDGTGDTASNEVAFDVTVTPTDTAPEVALIPDEDPIEVAEGSSVSLAILATDQDNDPLSLAVDIREGPCTGNGAEASLQYSLEQSGGAGSAEGVLTIDAGMRDAGPYCISIAAEDAAPGSESTTVEVDLVVNGVDLAPFIVFDLDFPALSVEEADAIAVSVLAGDDDGDAVSVSVAWTDDPCEAALVFGGTIGGLPGAAFSSSPVTDGVLGSFTWTPSYQAAGDYCFQFVARNPGAQGLSAAAWLSVHVADVNTPPSLSVTGVPPVNEGTDMVPIVVTATDQDSDLVDLKVTYSHGECGDGALIEGVPDRVEVDATAGYGMGRMELTWKPDYTQAGDYCFVFWQAGDDRAQVGLTVQVVDVDSSGMVELLGTEPASPANNTMPFVRGSTTLPDADFVSLYDNSLCAGDPIADASIAEFLGGGIPVDLAQDQRVTVYATATDEDFITTDCSASSISYFADSSLPQVTRIGGVVSYTGTATGRLFVVAEDARQRNGGGEPLGGTSIAGPGPWNINIRGVQGDLVTLVAWLDTQGDALPNPYADPMASTDIALDGGQVDVNITLTGPTPATPARPVARGVFPGDRAAFMFWESTDALPDNAPPASAYELHARTDPVLGGDALVLTLPANGDPFALLALPENGTWYFAVAAIAGVNRSPLSALFGPVAVGPRSGSPEVRGFVDFKGSPPAVPAYAVVYSGETGPIFAQAFPTQDTHYGYTISAVPEGEYQLGVIADLNSDGQIGPADLFTFGDQRTTPMVTVGGAELWAPEISVPTDDALARVNFNYRGWEGRDAGYDLRLIVSSNRKLPVQVTLVSGPEITTPIDMGIVRRREGGNRVSYSVPWRTSGWLEGTYSFALTYADGSGGMVDADLNLFGPATPIAPVETADNTMPYFSWDPPDHAPAGNFSYAITVFDGDGNPVWESGEIPSKSTGINWTSGTEITPLVPGRGYSWMVEVRSADGNRIRSEGAYFTVRRTVNVSPLFAILNPGQREQFSATYTGDETGGPYWWLREEEGGTITEEGWYTAPSMPGLYHVVAELEDGTEGEAVVIVTTVPQVSVTVSPKSVTLNTAQKQSFSARVLNSQVTAVVWSVEEDNSLITSGGLFTAPDAESVFHVTATSVADPSRSDTATVYVDNDVPQLYVTIDPPSASVERGGPGTFFVATVYNAENSDVDWSVREGGCCGMIDPSGYYSLLPSDGGPPSPYHVVATSRQDPSKSAVATVNVLLPQLWGEVAYSGSYAGQGPILVTLTRQQGGGPRGAFAGTAIERAGSFSIRGLTGDGPVRLDAWMDRLGVGRVNLAADPSASTEINLPRGVSTYAGTITLNDPPETVPVPPQVDQVFAGDGGFIIGWRRNQDQQGNEIVDHYFLYCESGTDWPPRGDGVLRTFTAGAADFGFMDDLDNNSDYQCALKVGAGGNRSEFSQPFQVRPTKRTGGTISGNIEFSPGFENTDAPVRVIAFAQNVGVFYTVVQLQPSGGNEISYQIEGVPPGTYSIFAGYDQNGSGQFDPTEPLVMDFMGGGPTVVVDEEGGFAPNIILPDEDVQTTVATSHWRNEWGDNYSMYFSVATGTSMPVRATLTDGPAVQVPIDMGMSSGDGGGGGPVQKPRYGLWWNMGLVPPLAGSLYEFELGFWDEDAASIATDTRQAAVTGVVKGLPVPIEPVGDGTTEPTFQWLPPYPEPEMPYYYELSLNSEPCCIGEGWGTGGITASQLSYKFRPERPSQALVAGRTYRWTIRARDKYGNTGESYAVFTAR